jgi:hypothetical protein
MAPLISGTSVQPITAKIFSGHAEAPKRDSKKVVKFRAKLNNFTLY